MNLVQRHDGAAGSTQKLQTLQRVLMMNRECERYGHVGKMTLRVVQHRSHIGNLAVQPLYTRDGGEDFGQK